MKKKPAPKKPDIYEAIKKSPPLPFITYTCPKGHTVQGFSYKGTLTCLECLGVKP